MMEFGEGEGRRGGERGRQMDGEMQRSTTGRRERHTHRGGEKERGIEDERGLTVLINAVVKAFFPPLVEKIQVKYMKYT